MSYFPTDRDILTSSLWVLGSPVQTKVWFYLMLSADPRTGIVSATVPAIAAGCVLSLEDTEKALDWLTQPDKYSRTKDHDGRRIEFLPDGRIRLLTYIQHKEKDYSTPRVQRFRERETGARNGETVDETVKRCETVSETTKTDTKTKTDTDKERGDPEPAPAADESDPHAFATELIGEINRHLPGLELKPHPAISFAVGNLLAVGHPKGIAFANGRTPLAREDLVDAAHGWIVAETLDPWHAEQRAKGSPFAFSRLVLDPDRLAEYAEKGRQFWPGWRSPESPPVEAPIPGPDPEILARHRKREAEDLARRKAEREAKPPEGMTARETREWQEKRGRKS